MLRKVQSVLSRGRGWEPLGDEFWHARVALCDQNQIYVLFMPAVVSSSDDITTYWDLYWSHQKVSPENQKTSRENLSEYSFSFVYCYFAISIPSRIANLQRFEVWVIVPGYGQLMYQFPKWYEMSFTQRELRSWLVLQTALLAILNPGSNSVVMRSRFGVFWLTFRNK